MGVITKEEKELRKDLLERGLKKCTKCGKILSVDNFFKNSKTYDGFRSSCKDCYSNFFVEYYQNNKDTIKLSKKQYREEHREELLEKERIYRENNPNKNKEYYYTHKEERKESKRDADKKYYKNHRDEILERVKQWRIDNKDKIRNQRKLHYEENREELLKKKKEYRDFHKEERKKYLQSDKGKAVNRTNRENRRARIKDSGGTFSADDVLSALLFFDNRCAYTGEPLEDNYHLDHIIPIKNGGSNYIDNIVPCNKLANLSKHTRNMEEWFREQEYFSEERLQKIYEWMNIKQTERKGDQNDGYYSSEEAS